MKMHVKLFRPTIFSSFRAYAPSNKNYSSFTGLTSEQFMKNPTNEPILDYKKGSFERKALEEAVERLSKILLPSDVSNHVARFTYATEEDIKHAIEVGLSVRQKWELKPLKERADIMLHAADLCASKYRMELNAATMLGQGKTLYKRGFVAAIAPFNFTAIGGNLASAPALMGNVVMWKPSDTAVLSNYIIYQILEEAGIPPGVLSFLPSDGPVFGNTICSSKNLAAINFTGSVPTFKYLWNCVAKNLDRYSTFPRLVGECGGKNFHFVHPSADVETVAIGTIKSAFEYQGQKCSACSRMYVPKSLWSSVKKNLSQLAEKIKVGDPRDGSVFMSAVIDSKSFSRIKEYINYAKEGHDGAKIVFGGGCEDSLGYFIEPTCVEVSDAGSKLLTHEIFGPVLTVLVYEDSEADNLIQTIKDATPYGLTGAVFSQDKDFLYKARDILRDAVGNLYLNDKSTGSVVGQQPFGGARLSGTNDKAGGPHYCLKWTSPQTIKETFVPLREWRYPHMD